MKEVTYEEWLKNPTPRMMWVWDEDVTHKIKAEVVCCYDAVRVKYPVISVNETDASFCMYKHCAEIEEPTATSETIDFYRDKYRPIIEDDYTFEYSDYKFEIASCVAGDKTLDRVVVFMYKEDEPPKLIPNAWHFGDDAIPGMPVPDDILDAIDVVLDTIKEE